MHMEAIVIHIEVHRVSMDTMDMDMAMARGLLMLDMAMVLLSMAMEAIVILIEAHRDSMDTMVDMDMDMDMDMDIMDMAKGLLSQDIMVMLALLFTKAVLTTMDTMDMVVLVTSKLTDHTLTMGSVLLILTKSGVRWRLCNSCNVKCQDTDITHNT